MKVNFRQGIVSHQDIPFQINGTNVDIKAATRPLTLTVAHKNTNYTHAEDDSVTAWALATGSPPDHQYIYWDFNQLTFVRTFGITTLEPVAQSVPPGFTNTPIVNVVPGVASPIAFGSFEVAGHYVLPTNRPFSVVNSTFNNGSYTVQTALYNTITGNTTITVNEAVVGGGSPIDGELTLTKDSFGIDLYTPGRHWFDTTNNIHYELIGTTWTEVLRVFAAHVINGTTLIGIGQNATISGDFTGTQVGNNNFVPSGKVLFAESGNADSLRRDDSTFFTTEDQFFTNQSRVDALRLESNVQRGQSEYGGSLAAFSVVAWKNDGKINVASYDDVGSTVVGMLTEPLTTNQVGAVIVQGTVTNSAWTWTTGINAVDVGSTLWVSNGELVTEDPNITSPLTYPTPQVPVGRVLSVDTIIFEQGLGGVGPRGPAPDITPDNLPPATATFLGGVRLLTPSSNSLTPLVITDTDSRLTDARTPLPHIHQALEIGFTPGGGLLSGDVQNALVELGITKLSLTGGAMSGPLILDADPTVPKGAATKRYVDALAAGIDAKSSVAVATTSALFGAGISYSPTGGTAGSGEFTNVNVESLDGLLGVNYNFLLTQRVLIKDQADAKQNGIYVITNIADTTLTILERAPDHDGSPASEVSVGNYVFISAGLVQAGQGWVVLGATSHDPSGTIDLNVDDMTWGQVSSAVGYFGGDNITIDGTNNISVVDASAGGTVDALTWNSEVISLTAPATEQPLIYNGAQWQNAAFALPNNVGTTADVITSDGLGGTSWQAVLTTAKPPYEKVVIPAGSPVSDVVNTTVATTALAGSPAQIASLQVFRNGMLQEEDITGDFTVTGANQLTFAASLLQGNDVIIIYVFI